MVCVGIVFRWRMVALDLLCGVFGISFLAGLRCFGVLGLLPWALFGWLGFLSFADYYGLWVSRWVWRLLDWCGWCLLGLMGKWWWFCGCDVGLLVVFVVVVCHSLVWL